LLKKKQVKINAGKIEQRFGVVMTPFSSSPSFDFTSVDCYLFLYHETFAYKEIVETMK